MSLSLFLFVVNADTRPSVLFTEQRRSFYAPLNRQCKKIVRARLRDIVTQLESGHAEAETDIDNYSSLAAVPILGLLNPPVQSNASLACVF